MPGDVIAEGEVRVGIDVSAAEAGLKRLEADFHRSMGAIDRSRAEAHAGVNVTELDRKLAEAKRKLLELDKANANPDADLDTTKFEAERKKLQAEIKELNQQKIEINVDSRQLRDANKQAAINAKRQAEMAKQSERLTRATEKAAQARRKESDALVRNSADVDRLRAKYNSLANEEQKLAQKTGRPGGIFHTEAERLNLQKLRSEMALTEHRIKSMGGTIQDIVPDLENNGSTLRNWGQSLSHVRLQMGFFSGTLRQVAIGFVALGPLITGLLGSMASLVGVAGTGLAGALSVAGAAAGGFALSAAGIAFVLKPAITDFKEATAASSAYHKAVLKYGKGSEQARDAQTKLNQVLKGVSPVAREAVKGFDQIKSKWANLTKGTKVPIFDAIGSSIKSVQALLPSFAKQTVATTKTVSDGWQKWMTTLRSPEAKEGLNALMSNFRQAIPSLMDGFGSLGAMIGNISVSASKMLPGLSKGFADWANNLMTAVGSGDQLDAKINRLVGHMRDIGHLAQASGRLLVNFFNTSADSGDSLVRSLTKTMNEWNKWVTSIEGQKSLKSFFADAGSETSNLFSALAHLVQLLFQLGRATAPLSDGFLKIITAIGDVVAAASKIQGVQNLLKGLGVALASIWVVGKVQAFTSAVAGAARALGILATSEAAVGVASGAGAAEGGLFASMFGRGGGKAVAAEAGAATAQLRMFAPAAAGAAESAGLLATVMAPEVMIPAASIAALALFIGKLDKTKTEFQELQAEVNKTTTALTNVGTQLGASDQKLASAKKDLNSAGQHQAKIYKELARLTDKGLVATPRWNQLMKELGNSQEATAKAAGKEVAAMRQRIETQQKTAALQKRAVNAAKEQIVEEEKHARLQSQNLNLGHEDEMVRQARLGGEKKLTAAMSAANAAEDKLALSQLNLHRIQSNLVPLSYQLAGALGKVRRGIGSAAATKISQIVDPKAAGEVARLSSKLTNLGQGSTVKNVLFNVKGDDKVISALRHIEAITIKDKTQKIKADVGTALRGIASVIGVKLPGKTQKVGANTGPAISAIASLLGIQLPTKIQRFLGDSSPVMSVIGALASIVLPPIVQTIVTHHVGKAEGGPAFAQGADVVAAKKQIKMQENAQRRQNRPMEVRRPTMLVGEEGTAGHPEWVIAQNPAYRAANERYLESAAYEFGYLLVPAHKTGVQANQKAAAGKPTPAATQLASKPKPKAQHGKHYYMKHDKFASDSVHEMNRLENLIQLKEGEYNKELRREEQEIDHKQRSAYDFGALKAFLVDERNASFKIERTLIPAIRGDIHKETAKANKALKGPLSAKHLHDLEHSANVLSKDYGNMRQGKDESDHAYRKRKNEKKAEVTAAKNRAKHLKEERDNALNIKREAQQELTELNQEVAGIRKVAREEVETEITNLNDIEGNPTLAPYYEPPEEPEKPETNVPSYGEQVASYNKARQQMFNSFASNIIDLPGAAGSGMGGAFAAVAKSVAASATGGAVGGSSYYPSGSGGVFAAGSAAAPAAAGSVVNVENNFAAPPPDPHTWAMGTKFELSTAVM